jgi:vacuolar iron transporter family protein
VAEALHDADALGSHLRDELGHTPGGGARPVQAALASAASFLLGGLVPFLGLLAHGSTLRPWLIVAITLTGLAAAGVIGARIAGGRVLRPALRVLLGGAAAMAVTALVGQIAHVSGV